MARRGAAGAAGGDRSGCSTGSARRRVLCQHRTFELAQLFARLDAQLVDERAPGVLVGLQRLGLAVGPVQGEHELAAEALPVRVLGDERLELPDDLGVGAEREARLDVQLGRRDPEVGETRGLALGERLVGEVGEWRPAPEGARLLEGRRRASRLAGVEIAPRLGDEPLEAPCVDLLGVGLQAVAVVAGDDRPGPPVDGERLAQARHVDLHGLRRGRGRSLGPQLVEQRVRAERLVRVEEQHRQQRALATSPERQRPVPFEDLERSEDAEFHGG